jgi:threonine aldolase
MTERLADDHAMARRLAEGLADMPGITSPGGIAQPAPGGLDPARVRTNFVLFGVERDPRAFLAALRGSGVIMDEYPTQQIRALTHHGIGPAEIDRTIVAVRDALRATTPLPADGGAA